MAFLNIAATGEDDTIYLKANQKTFTIIVNMRAPFSVDALSNNKQGVYIQSIPISFTKFIIKHIYISFDVHASITGGGNVIDLILNDTNAPMWFPVFRGLSLNIAGQNRNELILGTSNTFARDTTTELKRNSLYDDIVINFCDLVPIRDKQYHEYINRFVSLDSKRVFFQVIQPIGFNLGEDGAGLDFDGITTLFINYFKTLLSATNTFVPIEYKQTIHIHGEILKDGYQ